MDEWMNVVNGQYNGRGLRSRDPGPIVKQLSFSGVDI